MAKKQRKEPWNKKVNDYNDYNDNYDSQDNYQEDDYEFEEGRKGRAARLTSENAKASSNHKQKQKKSGVGSTVFLTFLVAIMFAIIGGAIIFTIWNNRKPNMKTVESNFYQSGKSSAASSSAASSSGTDTSSSSDAAASPADKTYTIQAGDYPSLIASNTGVSWDDILKLNPTLDPDNPGYYKDGSQITAGQTLTIAK